MPRAFGCGTMLRGALLVDTQSTVPQELGFIETFCDPSRLHEQMITQAIDVREELVAHRLIALQAPAYALGSAAYGAGLMQESVEDATTRKRERIERLQLLLHPVDFLLELLDLALPHLVHPFVFTLGRGREFTADVEQFVLDAAQRLDIPFVVSTETFAVLRQVGAYNAHDRVQLVDGPVRLEPRAFLGNARTADQRCRPFVASARVNPGEPYRHAALLEPAPPIRARPACVKICTSSRPLR